MSHFLVHRRLGRRLRARAAWATVLASITFAGVSVSVASASEPARAPVSGRPAVDGDGDTALEAPSSAPAAGEYIVQVEGGADLDDVVADVAADGVEVTRTLEGAIDAFTAPLNAQEVAELRARDDVVRVERRHVVELTGVQDNPPWGLDRIDQRALPLDSKYSYRDTGFNVDVYVVDSGIRKTHTEFTGRIKPGAYLDFGDGNGINDCLGHGTHVAGIVGGTTWGVAKAVSIVPVNVFPCGERSTSNDNIIVGLNWVIEHHQAGTRAVVNMSMGGPADAVLDDAVKAMVADGITVVVAAGNDANTSSCDGSPSRVPEVITVAASTSADARASFSSPGSCNDLFAPGVDIQSADYTSDTGSVVHSGTSMAAPHVAGAAALILHQNQTYTPAQVWAAMEADTTQGVITGEGTGDPDRLLHVHPAPKAPAAPTGLTTAVAPAAGVGGAQVKLTWTAPSDTGTDPITDYVVEKSPWNQFSWTTVDDGISSATTTTVSGLTNGTPYWFRVSAKSSAGVGNSTNSISATPASVPAAPTALMASVWPAPSVGSGQVRLLWDAAAANGSAITDYLIQSSLDGATWTTVDDGVSTANGFTMIGLTGGTNHSFRVAATNAVGTGPWSAIASATPTTEPAAPTGLTAAVAPAAGSGDVKLTWTAPSGNGSAITDYVVQRSSDGTTWTTVDDGVSVAKSSTVGALTLGTNYTFRVAATNGVGTGPWSATVSATPASTPDAPGTLTTSVAPATGAGPGQVKLTWTAPSGNGSAITDYEVQRSSDGTTWTSVDDGASTATSSTVSGLTNGTQYSFRVAGVNAAGAGAWSAIVTATPVWTPDVPTGLSAQVAPAAGIGSGEVRLTWAAPASNGAEITDYIVQSSDDSTTWTTVDDGVSTATTFTADGLTNGTQYRFRVIAQNLLGNGSSSVAITATPAWTPGVPARPTSAVAPVAGVGSGEVRLSWTAPSSNGAAITDYLIQRSTDGATWTTVADGVSSATTFTAGGLTNGRAYRFRIAAINAVGSGSWSAPTTAMPRWKPAAPGGLRAVAGARRVTLSWNAPASNGAAITDYVIQRSVNGKPWRTVRDGVSTARSRTVTGLTNGVPYRFRVAAKNAVGVGRWSLAVRVTTG